MDIYKEIELTTECQQLVPANIAYHYGVVPKEIKKGTLHLYAKQSTYSSLSPEELELILGNQIEFEPVNDDIINKALSKHYRSGGSKAQGADFELGNDF
ncbi:hypothetical protein ACFSO9_10025 [Mesonia maritima]